MEVNITNSMTQNQHSETTLFNTISHSQQYETRPTVSEIEMDFTFE